MNVFLRLNINVLVNLCAHVSYAELVVSHVVII